MHLVGFIIRILSRCTVTWMPNFCQMFIWVSLQWHKANEYKCHYYVERVFQSLYGVTAWCFAQGNFFMLYLSLPWLSSRSFHAVTKWRLRRGYWPFPAKPANEIHSRACKIRYVFEVQYLRRIKTLMNFALSFWHSNRIESIQSSRLCLTKMQRSRSFCLPYLHGLHLLYRLRLCRIQRKD